VDSDSARRLVDRLREIRTDRGATPAEAATAARKAASLTARFGLDTRPPPQTKRVPPRSRTRRPRRTPAPSFVFVAPLPNWWFDPNTGASSDNVEIKRYANRANWRIEVRM
jgi:Protein of unknown function (DUF2786)